MEKMFKPGDRIRCMGGTIKIVKWLDKGGQGDVYAVEQNGVQKALKWYKPTGMGKNPKAFYENLKENYIRGNPDKTVFLWPEDITEWINGTFGYVMPLRPRNYHEIGEFLLTTVRFRSMRTAVDAAMNIISAYRILHNAGYCYQDLNDGNFFIDPDTGNVLICDNDNVSPEGRYTGIIGKPGYIAPEIILGQQEENPKDRKMPDTYSDRFSMYIILFMLFTLTRPLEGRRTFKQPRSETFMEQVYGSDPHFIMDDVHHPEYGPDEAEQKNATMFWDALPVYMKELFLHAFSQESIRNPGIRPAEMVWLEALVRFRSEIIRCSCGMDIFTQNGESTVCSRCGRQIHIPYRLSFTGCDYKIPGMPDSRIYRCQVGPCDAKDALLPVGRVLANQVNPDQLGIRNLTQRHWNAETPGGRARRVAPQEIVPLVHGIKLMIGTEKIMIEDN